MRSALVAVSAVVLLSGAGAAPAVAQGPAAVPAPAVAGGLAPLTELFAERLLIADKVAAAKYGTDRPIDDPAREQKILDDVAARAVGLGLDPEAVMAVFRDQIEANKLVQRGLYAWWDAHPEERPAERPDLDTEVRPALDLITTRLLEALWETEGVRASSSCGARLSVAAVWSAYGHELDPLHLKGLARTLPSVCGQS
ncbi:gamma subclass chorismate mutase AroQ [Streptomyces dysideae]|uniref:chorismate mutase n=1 Tax=Streptomyces dysideae TaxID=909626 RepID=A0A101V0J1_9ACTN|nr:gamma subclass chorismate mutase AroQ [Streptomyces dysideae]KUO20243.1 chorismate mutase [Streptomyces dysideae]